MQGPFLNPESLAPCPLVTHESLSLTDQTCANMYSRNVAIHISHRISRMYKMQGHYTGSHENKLDCGKQLTLFKVRQGQKLDVLLVNVGS